uniref:C2H2-type domain-containing protein n=1 Tax=Glossina austeni TaxID=7395 RepID=A0A1A9VX28_GLOAU
MQNNSPNIIIDDEQPSCSSRTNQIHITSNSQNLISQTNNNTSDQNPSRFRSDTSCPMCERTFTTKTGVGVHMRRAHPDEHDQHKARTDVKQRWSEEEESLLARKEAELTVTGTRFMNKALAPLFPSSSLEAIKKKHIAKGWNRNSSRYEIRNMLCCVTCTKSLLSLNTILYMNILFRAHFTTVDLSEVYYTIWCDKINYVTKTERLTAMKIPQLSANNNRGRKYQQHST